MQADVLYGVTVRRHVTPRELLEARRAADDWLWQRLFAVPVQAERYPVPSKVEGSVRGPVKKLSPGAHSITQRRRRVKATRNDTP